MARGAGERETQEETHVTARETGASTARTDPCEVHNAAMMGSVVGRGEFAIQERQGWVEHWVHEVLTIADTVNGILRGDLVMEISPATHCLETRASTAGERMTLNR